MTRELIAGQSGWGKSWLCQQRVERNAENVDRVVVLDHEDEFRGLVKSGLCDWMGLGSVESQFDRGAWATLLNENPRLVVAKDVGADEWQDSIGAIAKAAEALDGETLLVIDESHLVAPLRASIPQAVEEIATTGRGRGVASIWVTQRLAKLDSTISSQCDRRLLGGFTSENDLSRVGKTVDYPADVHNPQLSRVSGLPDELTADGEPVPVRVTDPGSEWIYSTRAGDARRVDSSELTMTSTHYGPPGASLDPPGEA